MKKNDELTLKNSQKFLNDLKILLIGYFNYAISLEHLETTNTDKKPKKILINGVKLSNKYLGEDSSIAKKFVHHYNKKAPPSSKINFARK